MRGVGAAVGLMLIEGAMERVGAIVQVGSWEGTDVGREVGYWLIVGDNDGRGVGGLDFLATPVHTSQSSGQSQSQYTVPIPPSYPSISSLSSSVV